MAHLWHRSSSGLVAKALAAKEIWLTAEEGPAGSPHGHQHNMGRAALLMRVEAGAGPQWALIAPHDCHVLVNGRPPIAGLSVLRDRDEIRSASGALYYFSTESQVAVVEFPGMEHPVFCGRCRQRLEPGSSCVCCPACSIWFHQGSDLPCWTYSEKCPFCSRATSLETGFAWIPED
jgi:hypothetical protein